jgi:hypothetical protein
MLRFNVGGTMFTTTRHTIDKCERLIRIVDLSVGESGEGTIFIDRDPVVFSKFLKLLRGYPSECEDDLIDAEILCELVHWEHIMLQRPIPDWLQPQALTVHTLSPLQSEAFGQTHVLLPLKTIQSLIESRSLKGPLERFAVCYAIGATQGWTDSAWVSSREAKLAQIKYQYRTHFAEQQ